MKYPPYLGPWLLPCCLHKPAAIKRMLGHRDWVAQSLFDHCLVLTQAEGLLFGAAGAYAVAYAQLDKLLNMLPSYVAHDPADRREGDLVRVGEEHMPTDKG